MWCVESVDWSVSSGRTIEATESCLSTVVRPSITPGMEKAGGVEYSGELHAHMISLGPSSPSDSVGSDSRIGRNIEDI